MKTFRFNLGSIRILVQLAWGKAYHEIAIRKYEVVSRESVPEIERVLLRRLKTTVRSGRHQMENLG